MKKILRPYLFISICGLVAFAPLSFMLGALKNDVVALEYPINHFISQCIRNGELPYWFNTWGLGFPLHSNLTWGIFSTPQLAFSSLFHYDIYALHIEFIFYILLSGWGMFYLLRHYLLNEEKMAQLLATCYMLSGFMTGSTQWMLYITAAAFIPLLICALLKLLRAPSFASAFQAAVIYAIMFTSVYAALNIITTYSLLAFLLVYFLLPRKDKELNRARGRFLLVAAGLGILLCFPCLYFTVELLQHIERGSGLATQSPFFSSNYLHPAALSSLLFPFSSVRMRFPNTEGTMLDTYAGLFVLLSLPAAFALAWKEKNKAAWIMLAAALLYMVISFGALAPVRQLLNRLPGFSYFRNPAIFRYYFITALILFLAMAFRNRSWEELMNNKNSPASVATRYILWALAATCAILIIVNSKSLKGFHPDSLTSFVRTVNYPQALVISSVLQLILLLSLVIGTRRGRWKMATFIFSADLVLNSLLCMPFFSVSSYSLPEVNRILQPVKGFPVQAEKVSEVPGTFTDTKKNTWQNLNVFSKQVTSNESYRGPLLLKQQPWPDSTKKDYANPVIFLRGDSAGKALQIILQRPTQVIATGHFNTPGSVTLLQNYYKGWEAYVNNERTRIVEGGSPGMTIPVPAGDVRIDFRYNRKDIWLSALFLHLVVLGFLLYRLMGWLKKKFRLSSSPSSQR